ncbi:hypothetical protein QP888_02640 [Corynebacterium sp. MSK297]|nr:hypothetical protein [Corynebacterium sp. MSK297]MDK8845425.1 hypothetical protein [Corynebacterium sp. MSK297]
MAKDLALDPHFGRSTVLVDGGVAVSRVMGETCDTDQKFDTVWVNAG